ncbi:MAG: PTS sugar transporter subunit IIB [Clostridiales bacterium]|nr:PTS sugar transporter subunit IIB [Clostridiales bacterium]
MKKILFVCGTGGITSTVAENHVLEACKKAKVEVKTIRCSPNEINSMLDDIDFIVSTTAIGDAYTVPVISGVPLLIGIGKEKVLEQIVEMAKK